MSFLRHIIGLFLAMLVTALSVVAMPMAPVILHQADFLRNQQSLLAEHTEVHFAARAPPMAAANVAVSGATVAEQGNGVIMHEHEIHVTSLGFNADFDATNRGLSSFHGDTLVLTDGGLLPILDVNTNVSVWSRNASNGAMDWQPVQAQNSNPYDETVYVTIRDLEGGGSKRLSQTASSLSV